jgi:hypothetical protein
MKATPALTMIGSRVASAASFVFALFFTACAFGFTCATADGSIALSLLTSGFRVVAFLTGDGTASAAFLTAAARVLVVLGTVVCTTGAALALEEALVPDMI